METKLDTPLRNKASFDERFQKAKELTYKYFSEEQAKKLEAHNFYIDEPYPLPIIRNQEDLDKLIEEYENEEDEEYTNEEVQEMMSVWRNIR